MNADPLELGGNDVPETPPVFELLALIIAALRKADDMEGGPADEDSPLWHLYSAVENAIVAYLTANEWTIHDALKAYNRFIDIWFKGDYRDEADVVNAVLSDILITIIEENNDDEIPY